MSIFLTLPGLLLASSVAVASPHPICTRDLSTVPLNMRERLMRPAHLEERAIRPGLLHVQAEVCRCLPRRKRHHPGAVMARLHIAPNEGEVRVEYMLQSEVPRTRPMEQMVTCLGSPTLMVEPIPYRSDMRDEDGPIEEILVYPILMDLDA